MAMHFGLGLGLQVHAIFLLVFLAFHASSCEQEDYWQMKLPKVPMPQAIKDNLFHPKGSYVDDAKKNVDVDQPFTVGAWKYNSDNGKERDGIDQPFTVGAWKYNSKNGKERVAIDQPFTVGAWKYNSKNGKDRVGIDQPFTVGAWKYNSENGKERVDIDQPFTVGAWKYNSDNGKERVGVDQPFTVGAWKYNSENGKERVGIDQPFTVGAWKYNSENGKERVGVDQPFTVGAWKYNSENGKERVDIDQPFTVGAWKYNSENGKERVGIDQPFTVGAWKYNSENGKERVGIDQPFTFRAWKYNSNNGKERVGIDQPFTVGAWKYNSENGKERVGIDQPFTVGAWKYNSENGKERVGMDQPFTVGAWKYNSKNGKERVAIDQPFTVGAWKYNSKNANNKDNGDKEKDNDLRMGSVFFIEKSLRLGAKLKHDFQKTPSVPFLPKHFVQSIPFSDNKFTEILDLFSIKPGSPEATGIKGTLNICLHRPKVEKENRTCAQSMEDVVDFVVRELGSNDVELRMMRNDIEVPKGIQDYVVTKVKKLSVPSNTAAACHRMVYPYVVYYCHHQKDIGHYDVTLVNPTTNTAFQTTAVCHYDTYAWKPNVPALRYLEIRPGDAPVCHFSAINDMWWNLKPNSKSLDMVV